jgi:hypothetical protein
VTVEANGKKTEKTFKLSASESATVEVTLK